MKRTATMLLKALLVLYFISNSSFLLSKKRLKKNLDFLPSDVVSWHLISAKSYEDSSVLIRVKLETKNGFGLYADKIEIFQQNTWFFSKLTPPPTEQKKDPLSGEIIKVYNNGEFIILFKGSSPFQGDYFNFSIKYVSCNDKICLFPYEEKLKIKAILTEGTPPPEFIANSSLAQAPMKKTHSENKNLSKTQPEKKESLFSFNNNSFQKLKQGDSLSSSFLFLLFLFLAGLVTNFTPCVYPMIPITIRILGQQNKSPLKASSLYALGIMTTYTALGFFAAMTGSLFGQVMSNVYVNLLLACLMTFLAIGMMGYGRYNWLQNLGNKISEGSSGLKTCFLMGLGAGLVASPCTGPVLAALLAYSVTANVSTAMTALYLLTYSFGFSFPYVVLGRLASKVTKIKLKDSIQSTVKIIFSAIMLSLAFYYLRIPFYGLHKSLGFYWPQLSATGLALFLFFYFVLKSHKNFFMQLLALTFLGFSFFSFAQWLTAPKKAPVTWHKEEQAALTARNTKDGPLLIDMWAEWCELCKKMDRTTFSNQKLMKTLKENNWTLLKLDLTHTTDITDSYRKKYGVKGLPALIIIPDPNKNEKIILNGYVTADMILEQIKKHRK